MDANNSERWEGFGSQPAGGIVLAPRDKRRSSRAAITRVLADGKRMTVRQIATALRTTTRAVHQVVCNAVGEQKRSWLRREKPEGSEYVYFLAGEQG